MILPAVPATISNHHTGKTVMAQTARTEADKATIVAKPTIGDGELGNQAIDKTVLHGSVARTH